MVTNRNIQLDIIRCMALFLIILCHTQIGFENISPVVEKLKWFVSKCGVPLFLIISGYLNLPAKYSDTEFISKRFKRVFIPFLLWCIIYRILSVVIDNTEFFTFTEDIFLIAPSAHLWYVYAILALYLVTPIISNYFRDCSKRMFQFYLLIWLLTTAFSYYYHFSGHTFFDHNITYVTYYVGGYLGYYLLGYYIKRFTPYWIVGKWNLMKCALFVGVLLIGVGFVYLGFFHLQMTTVEISSYVTIVPVLFSMLMFSILWRIKVTNAYVIKTIISLSKYSFGIYLVHEAIIYYVFPQFSWITSMELNNFTVLPINIVIVLLNIIMSYIIIRLLSMLPKSKYLLG